MMMDTFDNSEGFDLSQTLTTIIEVLPDNSGDQKVISDESAREMTSIENDLFESLKLHIDTECKLNQLYHSRLRSFERFRKYCQTLSQIDGDGTSVEKFDPERFRNEFNKFDQNYRYLRKRIRNLRKQTKYSLSTRYQNPYDTLHDLFTKIENVGRSKDNSKTNNTEITDTTSTENLTTFKTENTITNNTETNNTNNKENYSADQISTENKPSKALENTSSNDSVTMNEFKCFAARCGQTFSSKSLYLEHTQTEHCKTRKKRAIKKRKSAKKVAAKKTATKRQPKSKSVPQTRSRVSTRLEKKNEQEDSQGSDDRPFKCDQCELTFKYKSTMSEHQKVVHQGKRYFCPYNFCPVNFATAHSLKTHVKMSHTDEPPGYHCPVEGCSYASYQPEHLQRHKAVHSTERPFKCTWPNCTKAFKLNATLKDHIRSHKNERKYKCKLVADCVFAFNTYSGLVKHHAWHESRHPEEILPRIQKTSRRTDNLRPPATLKKCEYEGCGYAHRSQAILKKHQTTHTDLRAFQCDQCGMTFKYKSTWSEHLKVVHEGKRYECPFVGCQANFATANNLRKHVQIAHTKDPPVYRCEAEGCNYSSFREEALRRHRAVHSEERPFKCMWPGCGKAFKLNCTRKEHILTHKNERQYKCKWPDCSYACNNSNNLVKHHSMHEKKSAKAIIQSQAEEPNQIISTNNIINNNNNNDIQLMAIEVAMAYPSS